MISIAIALVLIVGVNEVFKIGAQTVGAGQAFSSITRDERTAQFSFYSDIHNATTVAQPALQFSSQCQYAFRNAVEAAAEPNTTGPGGTASPGVITINHVGLPVSTVLLGSRNYRIDTLGFFASGDIYQRQTASLGYFVSPTTSTDAYIWYGHLALPNNAQITGAVAPSNWYGPGGKGDLFDPGQSTGFLNNATGNDNNLYATQWILGRMAMLMVPGASTNPQPSPADLSYYYLIPPPSNPLPNNNPLSYNTLAQGTDPSPIQSSRYDLVSHSAAYIGTTFNSPTLRSLMLLRALPTASPSNNYSILPMQPFRYEANPFPIKPLNAASMAGVAPMFLNHCCNFVVEYAGDYLTQVQYNPASGADNSKWGQIMTLTASGAPVGNSGAQGDGVVDFVVDKSRDPNAGTAQQNPALWVAKTRWYGFPRDVNGDGVIDPINDVVPLRDILQLAAPYGVGAGPNAAAPWEGGDLLNAPPPTSNNYAATTPPVSTGSQYLCSWGTESAWPLATGVGSGLPRMLRITISLDDASGRLAGPQTYEYVIDLGAQH
jgi:hypothetical protein